METSEISELIKAAVLVDVPTDALIPYAKNPRKHPEGQIKDLMTSIKSFGFTSPLLIGTDKTLIAGHGRLIAAQRLGLESVPCIVLSHLSENQKRALIIADSRIAEKASWNLELLSLELQDLKLQDFQVELLGFEPKQMAKLLDPLAHEKKKERRKKAKGESADLSKIKLPDPGLGEFSIRARTGEIWALGLHRLIVGDAGDDAQIKMLMAGQRANLVITRPEVDQEIFYVTAFEICEPGSSIYVFHPDGETLKVRAALNDAGWDIRQTLIWVKEAPGDVSKASDQDEYRLVHEPVFYGFKDGGQRLVPKWYGEHQTSVLNYPSPRQYMGINPIVVKPLELLEMLIRNSTSPADIVFDGFLGCGDTLLAADIAQRICYGAEASESFATVAISSWEMQTGLKAERIFPPTHDEVGEDEEKAPPESFDLRDAQHLEPTGN